ncbi:MAG: hypothetical protein U5K69_02045 [Balneolaceae bacterium]|nr:hypothetical protein [Balneolaceae bacterium]
MNILFTYMFLGCMVFLLAGFSGSKAQTSSTEQQVSVMSYNIRYDNPDDGINRWDLRKEELLNQVKLYNPHFSENPGST